ncbi:hypothetical protein BFJ65_g2119 [Fusarium oxysporum f. sp. cepae]|uniref:Uncharacterized protein n=1 Tax=Fusarium oxysporum f. sp. cepae TaxID=396571 RepID=A0A3L6PAR1_FUSOX|nr:hypothetical protein BFJ65_g2119 [Fusarium oxysporum f. sp. cepae]
MPLVLVGDDEAVARIGQASGLGPPDAQDARSMGEQWGLVHNI